MNHLEDASYSISLMRVIIELNSRQTSIVNKDYLDYYNEFVVIVEKRILIF